MPGDVCPLAVHLGADWEWREDLLNAITTLFHRPSGAWVRCDAPSLLRLGNEDAAMVAQALASATDKAGQFRVDWYRSFHPETLKAIRTRWKVVRINGDTP